MGAWERAMDAAHQLEDALDDVYLMRENSGKKYTRTQLDMLTKLVEDCASSEALADQEMFDDA